MLRVGSASSESQLAGMGPAARTSNIHPVAVTASLAANDATCSFQPACAHPPVMLVSHMLSRVTSKPSSAHSGGSSPAYRQRQGELLRQGHGERQLCAATTTIWGPLSNLTGQRVAIHAQRSEHSPRGPLGWQRALKTVADQDELVEGGQSSQSGPGGRERACMCQKRLPGGAWVEHLCDIRAQCSHTAGLAAFKVMSTPATKKHEREDLPESVLLETSSRVRLAKAPLGSAHASGRARLSLLSAGESPSRQHQQRA